MQQLVDDAVDGQLDLGADGRVEVRHAAVEPGELGLDDLARPGPQRDHRGGDRLRAPLR